MSQLYRPGKLGEALIDALETLIKENKITETLAIEVLAEFDRSMNRSFETKVSAKGSIKGKLDVYRYIDNVWTFVISEPSLRVAPTMTATRRDEEEVKMEGPLKLVLVDSKVVKFATDNDDGGGGGGKGDGGDDDAPKGEGGGGVAAEVSHGS